MTWNAQKKRSPDLKVDEKLLSPPHCDLHQRLYNEHCQSNLIIQLIHFKYVLIYNVLIKHKKYKCYNYHMPSFNTYPH